MKELAKQVATEKEIDVISKYGPSIRNMVQVHIGLLEYVKRKIMIQ